MVAGGHSRPAKGPAPAKGELQTKAPAGLLTGAPAALGGWGLALLLH